MYKNLPNSEHYNINRFYKNNNCLNNNRLGFENWNYNDRYEKRTKNLLQSGKYFNTINNNTIRRKAINLSKSMFEIILKFLEISSVHGLNHITAKRRHPIEYIFWTIFVLIGAASAIQMSLTTWYRYQQNPTVISMERDYKEWNTSFPAVSVCPMIKVEESKLLSFIEERYLNEIDNEDLKRFLTDLMNVNYTVFDDVHKYGAISANQYLNIIEQLKYNFTYSVSSSHSDVYGIMDLIPSMTEVGYCYSYNSEIAIYNQPEYWKTGKFSIIEQAPPLTGSPLDGDMFAQLMGMSCGYTMYIHSPFETFDIASKLLSSEYMNYKTLELSGLSIYSSQETRSLSIAQRKCRFIEESELLLSPIYTYKMCRTECRMKLAKKLCGCVPHFYRPLKTYKTCDVAGMHCLGEHQELLIKLRDPSKDYEKIPCSCLPPCDDISYVVESETAMQWFLGTLLKWGLVKYPRLRLKRDIIFGFTDLLVATGGTAGLFLGCSVLSFIEFFYFFTFHLFCMNRKKIR